MRTVVNAFVPRLKRAAPENLNANQNTFMKFVSQLTIKQDGLMVLKPEFK